MFRSPFKFAETGSAPRAATSGMSQLPRARQEFQGILKSFSRFVPRAAEPAPPWRFPPESPGGGFVVEVSHSSLRWPRRGGAADSAFTNPRNQARRPPRNGGLHMAARSSWKGFLRLSLGAAPFKASPASTSGGGDIH